MYIDEFWIRFSFFGLQLPWVLSVIFTDRYSSNIISNQILESDFYCALDVAKFLYRTIIQAVYLIFPNISNTTNKVKNAF